MNGTKTGLKWTPSVYLLSPFQILQPLIPNTAAATCSEQSDELWASTPWQRISSSFLPQDFSAAGVSLPFTNGGDQLNKHPYTASLSSLFYFPSLISRSCCLGSKPQIKYCASTSRGLQERKWERAIHFPTLKRAINIQVKIITIIGQNSTCNYQIKSDHRVSVLGLNRKDPRGLFKDQILLLKGKSFNETEKYFK